MLRVLYIVDCFLYRSGISRFITNYLRYLDSSKIQIDVLEFYKGDSEVENELQSLGTHVYRLEIKALSVRSIIQLYKKLNDFFSQHAGKYDIVHSHFYQLDFLFFYFAKKYHVKVCVSHSHASSWGDRKLQQIRNRLMALPVPYIADAWGACSIQAGECLYGKRFSHSSRAKIIHNVIDVKHFVYNQNARNVIRQRFQYGDEIVLGTVGNLTYVKNQCFLLDILKSLCDEGMRQYRLLIVGAGELRGDLEEKVLQLGLKEYVCFAGACFDISPFLQAMDIFLLPSYSEGFPLVSLEAQTSGLPCLFSEGVPPEAVLIHARRLSVYRGTKIWTEAIKEIDAETIRARTSQEKLVASMGYGVEEEVEEMIKFYKSLLAEMKE